MKLSAKSEYACVAMLELAAGHASGEPVRIRSIADQHGIPSRFLVQILLQLKGAGLVVSTRGAAGGYALARTPEEITLGEVMEVIEGPDETPASNVSPESRLARVLHECWRNVLRVERELLRGATLAQLVERSRRPTEAMYYI